MKKNFFIVIAILLLAILIVYVFYNINQKENLVSSPNKSIDLSLLVDKLNSNTDKSVIAQKFKLMKTACDPLYEIPASEGSENNATDKGLSVSYGVEGIYKVTDTADLQVTIVKDDTDTNGGYVITRPKGSYQSSVFKYKDSFLVFEILEKSDDEKVIASDRIKISEFIQKFFNTYKTIIAKENSK